MEDKKVKDASQKEASEIENFGVKTLQRKFSRDNYREFLKLYFIFLDKYRKNYTFRKPGACHHVRSMSKAIYILKMYLFRAELNLRKKIEEV